MSNKLVGQGGKETSPVCPMPFCGCSFVPYYSVLCALSAIARNRLVHLTVGNISMKDLLEVLEGRLGMCQDWAKPAAKALLQNTALKNQVEELYKTKAFFEIGKLALDLRVPTSASKGKGGKGAGKGSPARTPWQTLIPKPSGMFVDQNGDVVECISSTIAHTKAAGVFLSTNLDFLKITSSQPFAVLLPATPNIRDKLQEQNILFESVRLH